jgi:hypothetical protein
MPSRKQRRRREKLQRHEYEYVVETEDGEEIPVERPVEREPGGSKRPAKAGAAQGGRRQVPKPSLARVAKRTAIFAPVILLVVFLTAGKDSTMGAKIFTAVTLLAFFIPFSYMVDTLMYRAFTKRQQRETGSS